MLLLLLFFLFSKFEKLKFPLKKYYCFSSFKAVETKILNLLTNTMENLWYNVP